MVVNMVEPYFALNHITEYDHSPDSFETVFKYLKTLADEEGELFDNLFSSTRKKTGQLCYPVDVSCCVILSAVATQSSQGRQDASITCSYSFLNARMRKS
jgi:hypothetical protein